PFYESEAMFGLGGPAAPAIIAALLEPRRDEKEIRETPYLAYFSVMFAGVPCRLFRDGRWAQTQGPPLFYLCAPPMGLEALLNALHEACRAAGGRLIGAAALKFARMQFGVARWGEALGEGRIPREAYLQGAIHCTQ